MPETARDGIGGTRIFRVPVSPGLQIVSLTQHTKTTIIERYPCRCQPGALENGAQPRASTVLGEISLLGRRKWTAKHAKGARIGE